MKRTVKLALFVCLILLASALALTACNNTNNNPTPEETTPDYFLYQLNADGNTCSIVGLINCMDTELVIPTTYNNKPVTEIGAGAFRNASFLTSIVIPESVTHIGEGAFRGCSNLKSISIPESVTHIGKEAFYECDNLAYSEYDNA